METFKKLVAHLMQNNLQQIVDKSILNCHAQGLHSIMLIDSPGQTVRVYVTDKDHVLWRNYPQMVMDSKYSMTLAFHPHHCNLTLICTEGKFLNWTVTKNKYTGMEFKKYLYKSQITGGEMKFEFQSYVVLAHEKAQVLNPGDCVMMQADQIHTVACPIGEQSAWIVIEGKSDSEYVPYCYADSDLEKADSRFLYQKATKEDVERLLKVANLL